LRTQSKRKVAQKHVSTAVFNKHESLRSTRMGLLDLIGKEQYDSKQKSEHDVLIFVSFHCFYTDATRFLFFISVPGMLVLRASCFSIRVCLRAPLDDRLGLVLIVVSTCITPCCVMHYFYYWLHILPRACQFPLWLSDGYIHI
jgi:hypothetical protein